MLHSLHIKKLIYSGILLLGIVCNANAASWYIDNTASGSHNGTSWTNAWASFSQIVWGAGGVVGGDTLYISGGSTSKTYTATGNNMLTVGASGSSGSRITIATGAKSPSPTGHNGLVIFDGNSNYNTLINVASRNYITIDGEKSGATNWQFKNVSMSSSENAAIDFSSSNFFIATYLEILTIPMGLYGTYANDSEISYCNIHDLRQECAVRTIVGNSGATAYGRTKLHHNTIVVSTSAPNGYGPDGFQTGESTDVYNNNFSSVNGTIGGAQHPDYIQTAGRYTRIYNNTFRNPIDSAVDFDVSGNMDGLWEHIWIYNNVFVCDSTISAESSWPSGIRMYNNTDSTITDIVIANNTFVDWGATGGKAGYPFRLQTGGSASVTSTQVKNNIFYNSGNGSYEAVIIEASSGATAADWNFDYNLINAGSGGSSAVTVDGSSYTQTHNRTSAPAFSTYSAGSASNVYTLSLSDTAAKDQGVDLSAYFTTDKTGATRSGSWDIGAYEYTSGITWQVTFDPGAHGTITQGSTPQTVNDGSDCSAVGVTASTGYHFTSWSPGGSTNNPVTITGVTADATYTAQYAIDTHTLTYAAGTCASITGTTPQTVNYGASGSQVTAVPAGGYHFVQWDDANGNASRTDTNVIADRTYTASCAADASSYSSGKRSGGKATGGFFR